MPSQDIFFERPPVVERVLGAQFDSIPGLHNGLLGRFWAELGPEWEKASHAPPFKEEFEQFGKSSLWGAGPTLTFSLRNEPASRLIMEDSSGSRILQVQNGRFHFNWRGDPAKDYPRYDVLKKQFFEFLGRFVRFVESAGLGTPRMNQWEITYLNHLPKGTVWENPDDWGSLLRCPTLAQSPGGAILESFAGEWHYEIPPQQGRLHINVKHKRDGSRTDLDLSLQILTARGPVLQSPGVGSMKVFETGLGIGHQAIVRAFQDITPPAAHEFWRRTDERNNGGRQPSPDIQTGDSAE